jgi:hypothetical protein
MEKGSKSSRTWIILVLMNALVMITPVVYYVRATDDEARRFWVILLVVVSFILAIADVRSSMPRRL